MQETDIIGGTNPNREIYDNRSGGLTDMKNVQKKAVFLRFYERSVITKTSENDNRGFDSFGFPGNKQFNDSSFQASQL
jgi:hypothetical protein